MLVYDLMDGEIDIVDLVDIGLQNRDGVLKNTVMLSALRNSNSSQIIFP